MRKIKNLLVVVTLCSILFACADSKSFIIDGKRVEVEPYGWADQETKHDSVIYGVCVGNVVWSCIGFQNIVTPVVLTGWYLWEPRMLVRDKK